MLPLLKFLLMFKIDFSVFTEKKPGHFRLRPTPLWPLCAMPPRRTPSCLPTRHRSPRLQSAHCSGTNRIKKRHSLWLFVIIISFLFEFIITMMSLFNLFLVSFLFVWIYYYHKCTLSKCFFLIWFYVLVEKIYIVIAEGLLLLKFLFFWR